MARDSELRALGAKVSRLNLLTTDDPTSDIPLRGTFAQGVCQLRISGGLIQQFVAATNASSFTVFQSCIAFPAPFLSFDTSTVC